MLGEMLHDPTRASFLWRKHSSQTGKKAWMTMTPELLTRPLINSWCCISPGLTRFPWALQGCCESAHKNTPKGRWTGCAWLSCTALLRLIKGLSGYLWIVTCPLYISVLLRRKQNRRCWFWYKKLLKGLNSKSLHTQLEGKTCQGEDDGKACFHRITVLQPSLITVQKKKEETLLFVC